MLVERNVQILNVEVVGEAYDIAAYYLRKTGQIADSGRIDDRLLEADLQAVRLRRPQPAAAGQQGDLQVRARPALTSFVTRR